MSDYEYIINECKKAHYGKWEEQNFAACVSRLEKLTHQQLVKLLRSQWLNREDEFRKVVGRLFFKVQIEEHQRMINTSSIDELGEMLTEKNGNNVKWARAELKKRYQETDHGNQMKIIGYFIKGTTKQDVKWGEVRKKWQALGFANPPSIFDSWKK